MSALFDSGAEVNLISQWLVVALQLGPEPQAPLDLKWVNGERRNTYGVYAIRLRLADDLGRERTVTNFFYGVDMEGPELVFGNAFGYDENIRLDLGSQMFTWGIEGPAAVQLATIEELEQSAEPVGFLGMAHADAYPAVDPGAVRTMTAPPSDPPILIPAPLKEYEDVFSLEAASILPQNRPTDHAIDLLPDREPPYGPLYNLSGRELEILREYLEKALASGWIQHSTGPAGAPILFVPKKDGTLRLCVDYRGLNSMTIKNRCPLPLISETLDRLCGARYLTRLDLKDAYHRIRIRPGDEWKTAFRTRYGHFEYLVMPFGLCNAPATFQAYVNRTLSALLDTCVAVYLDDILIYTHEDDIAVHWRRVREVLALLRDASLFVNLKKCEFAVQELGFVGFIVSTAGVSMDPSRIATIVEWPVPGCVRDIQVFLGFCNFYRRFIYRYSQVARALTDCLKDEAKQNF